jgi:RNA polymerase sigma factor (sigma-70 family)
MEVVEMSRGTDPPDGDVAAEARARVASVDDALYRYAYLLAGQTGQAEDLVQETWVRILSSPNGIVDATHPRAYAKRTLTNLFLDDQRRIRVARSKLAALADPADDVEHEVAVADRETLWQALQRLPRRQRAAVVLRYYDDLTFADIASVLDCREATARSLVHRGLRQLNIDLSEGWT